MPGTCCTESFLWFSKSFFYCVSYRLRVAWVNFDWIVHLPTSSSRRVVRNYYQNFFKLLLLLYAATVCGWFPGKKPLYFCARVWSLRLCLERISTLSFKVLFACIFVFTFFCCVFQIEIYNYFPITMKPVDPLSALHARFDPVVFFWVL